MEMSYRRNPDKWQVTTLHAINKAIQEKRVASEELMPSDSDSLRQKALQVVPE